MLVYAIRNRDAVFKDIRKADLQPSNLEFFLVDDEGFEESLEYIALDGGEHILQTDEGEWIALSEDKYMAILPDDEDAPAVYKPETAPEAFATSDPVGFDIESAGNSVDADAEFDTALQKFGAYVKAQAGKDESADAVEILNALTESEAETFAYMDATAPALANTVNALQARLEALEARLPVFTKTEDMSSSDRLRKLEEDMSEVRELVTPEITDSLSSIIDALGDSITARSRHVTALLQRAVSVMVQTYMHYEQIGKLVYGGRAVNPEEYANWDTSLLLEITGRISADYRHTRDSLSRKDAEVSRYREEAEAAKSEVTRLSQEAKNNADLIERLRETREGGLTAPDIDGLKTQLAAALALNAKLQAKVEGFKEPQETYAVYCAEASAFICVDRHAKTVEFTNNISAGKSMTIFTQDSLSQGMRHVATWLEAAVDGKSEFTENGVTKFTLMPMRLLFKAGKSYSVARKGNGIDIREITDTKPFNPVKSIPVIELQAEDGATDDDEAIAATDATDAKRQGLVIAIPGKSEPVDEDMDSDGEDESKVNTDSDVLDAGQTAEDSDEDSLEEDGTDNLSAPDFTPKAKPPMKSVLRPGVKPAGKPLVFGNASKFRRVR